MSVFRCKMCGGSVEFQPGETTGVCDSCGTRQTLPRLDDERKRNLYDRADHYRRNDDFDRAKGIYEQILNEDETDAEAYWSLVLCRYGIEYVEDPLSRRQVPTINRMQYTSVYADGDYKSALRYADAEQRVLYEAEAAEIDGIQRKILEVSGKEEPFDVFICYKESDANGRRTPDSVLAGELYHELTEEGFRVFYSRITLEDKLGTEYEPYIFAALNSARVMVVLGTKPEYFTAVWVKNEWSRYLALIGKGERKQLIPAYRDMDPYDLPEEFSHLQALDMSRLGFMQDLVRGIGKIAGESASEKDGAGLLQTGRAGAEALPLLSGAFALLGRGGWEEADQCFEDVLDLEPENAEAYLGKLMAELHVRKREQLVNCKESFENSRNCELALRFGDEALKKKLSDILQQVRENRTADLYEKAVSVMKSAGTEKTYQAAAEIFRNMNGYRDSDKLAAECMENAEFCRKDEIYKSGKNLLENGTTEDCNHAMELFRSIAGWKDSEEMIQACMKKAEKNQKERKIVSQILLGLAVLAISFYLLACCGGM